MTNLTTCQICGRAIKAKRGAIAHHGYKRPGNGWQTASCFGAGYRPWEVACDALPKAIAGVQAQTLRTRDTLTDLIENPPEQISEIKFSGWTKREEKADRPADFDRFNRPAAYMPRSYAYLYWTRRSRLESDIKDMSAFVAELEARLVSWKPPAEAVA